MGREEWLGLGAPVKQIRPRLFSLSSSAAQRLEEALPPKKIVRNSLQIALTNKKGMGKSRYKFREEHYPYFITCSTVKGISLFAYQDISKIIIESIKHLQNKEKVDVYAYVLMHNHIHLIFESENPADKMRKFKSYTARCIIDHLKGQNRRYFLSELKAYKHSKHKDSQYQVWQAGVHPKQISNARIMKQKIEYVHYNPVKAGFVELPQHWKYSSARNYLGEGNAAIPVKLFSG